MAKPLTLLYGVISYLIGLGGLTYFILFMGSWTFLPIHINSAEPTSLTAALLINFGLTTLFALQHSIMARDGFKNALSKIIPTAAERPTYVLMSGLALLLVCCQWRATEGTAWSVDNPTIAATLIGIYAIGWLFSVAATFQINHFDLMGLKQVTDNFRDKPEAAPFFVERWFYRYVRHPIQTGVLIGIWATPHMTITHLMMSVLMTTYIFIGLHYEEKSLVDSLGDTYRDYQKRVPKLFPFMRP